MININSVTKTYNSLIAVNDLNLEIPAGEHLCLLGPSGCGKTTLLRLIAGFEQLDSGEVIINKRIVSSPGKLIPPHQRKIGMVFQDLALWPHMTVRENIEFGISEALSRKDRNKKIEKVLNLVGLHTHLNYYPNQLSGGQQQRVALARTLVLEPQILLLDEPLSSLDFQLREELKKVITELQKRLKITTVYVTHNQDEAVAMADRIAIMNKGKIEQVGMFGTLRNKPKTDFVKIFLRS